jgi:FkbM family methyltransferase
MNPRKVSARVLRGVGVRLQRLAMQLYLPPEDPQTVRVRSWFAVNGDQTLRLNYDLHPDSVVFDVGGYQGQWASDIFARFGCEVHIFEPITEYAGYIRQRFAGNGKIKVNEKGLAGTDRLDRISINKNLSSVLNAGTVMTQQVTLVSAATYIRECGIETVDLVKINIEGMEYELLDHLIDTELIRFCRNIQVQFHSFVPDAEDRMGLIQKRLTATHHITYQFPFVWENWAINESQPCESP